MGKILGYFAVFLAAAFLVSCSAKDRREDIPENSPDLGKAPDIDDIQAVNTPSEEIKEVPPEAIMPSEAEKAGTEEVPPPVDYDEAPAG